MELIVELDNESEVMPIRVSVDPNHSVTELAAACVRWAGRPMQSDPQLIHRPFATTIDRVLDSSMTMGEAGVVSGDRLILTDQTGVTRRLWARPASTGDPAGSAVVPTIVGGPDIGQYREMATGSLVMGRDPSCQWVVSDPAFGRQQCTVGTDRDGRWWIETMAETRGEVRIDGVKVTGRQHFDTDQEVVTGNSVLALRPRPVPVEVANRQIDAHGQIAFHRSPYFPEPVGSLQLNPVTSVPSRPEPQRFSYLAALVPLVLAVGMAAMLQSPNYLLFGLMSPVMAVAAFIERRRRSGESFDEQLARFNLELIEGEEALWAARAEERRRRRQSAPDLVALSTRVLELSPSVWVRSRQAEEFLTVRCGVGNVGSAVEATLPSGGDEEFRREMIRRFTQSSAGPFGVSPTGAADPASKGYRAAIEYPQEQAEPKTATLVDVPITINLCRDGVVALTGGRCEVDGLAASLVLQACCWHSPEDLVLVSAVGPRRGLLDHFKWLPQSRSGASPLSGHHLVDSPSAGDDLLVRLLTEAERRLEGNGRDRADLFPWILVVIDQGIGVDPSLASRLLDRCPQAGISVLWLTDSPSRAPRQATAVIECASPVAPSPSLLHFTDPDRIDRQMLVERADTDLVPTVARALAPLRDATAVDAVTAIPTVVPLFGFFGAEPVSGKGIASRWRSSAQVPTSLAAPVGEGESGPLVIDLIAHGPHGLIGGTSGSGKSELLMSMVASLMAAHPPEKLNFLFVDYKGGASSEVFSRAPHTVGCVTNLDAALSERALTSLGAELNRRMALLSGRAKDVVELRASGAPDAPPSLVIVIDEFATLVKEVPGFVDGVVDIAQRGRSLGIHLLLATQRPSGVVNDNIKANTNLRIALRMLDAAESSSVIGTAEAAAIPGPLKGRGYVNRGDGRLIAFQSGWAGAPVSEGETTNPISITDFTATGTENREASSAPLFPASSSGSSGPDGAEKRTQLDVLLEAIDEAAVLGRHHSGPAPWIEPLPETVLLGDALAGAENPNGRALATRDRRPGLDIVIGMVDDPTTQSHYSAMVDLGQAGGLWVLGAPGSGKTTLLRTLATAAALDDSAHGGGLVTIVGLDFGSRALTCLRDLPQCAGVATGDDVEAVARLVGVLGAEFDRRRSAVGGPVESKALILLVIDGLDTLTQSFEQAGHGSGLPPIYERLAEIIANGHSNRIVTVASAGRRAAVRSGVTAAFTERILLRQSENSSYLDAGLGSGQAAKLNLQPGQGLWSGSDTNNVSLQVARLSDGSAGEEAETVRKLARGLVGSVAPELKTGPLPNAIPLAPSSDPRRPVVAVADMTLTPVHLDLTHENVYVQGEARTGRSTTLATIAAQAAAGGAEVWAVGTSSSPLAHSDWAHRQAFGDQAALTELLGELADSAPSNESFQLLVIDDVDLILEDFTGISTAFDGVLRKVRWVAVGPRLSGYIGDPTLQQMKKARTAIYLNPIDSREAAEVFGVSVPWHPGLAMTPGRGHIMAQRRATLVQFMAEVPELGRSTT